MRRGGFTVKLMELKLLCPTIARAPSKALGGALDIPQKYPKNITAHV